MLLAMTFLILWNAVCQRWEGLHNSVNQMPSAHFFQVIHGGNFHSSNRVTESPWMWFWVPHND